MTASDQEPEEHRLAADRPIERADQDLLGRQGFASQIRLEVEAAPRDDGFVIAVTGAWGSGKTSVINMAVEQLVPEKGYRVLKFNPWMFSGTPQLVEHFFAELSAQFKKTGNDRLAAIGASLERYGKLIDPLRFLPGVDKLADLGKGIGGILSRRGKGESSAREQRAALNEALAAHDEVLVIVLDDIDRLRDDEITDVMRLVRLVADFPNTVYILAFDTERVAAALATSAEDGHAYLEKIVQVSHGVPAIPPDLLSDLFVARLTEATSGIEYRLDPKHWAGIYGDTRGYFSTARDVVRYCNHIRAPMTLLAEEVEASDVLGLEAIRMFEPRVWKRLSDAAEALTRTSGLGPSRPTQDDNDKREIENLISAAKNPERMRSLITQLFPASERHLGRSTYGGEWQSTWQRQRRVASSSVLRVYLGYQLPPGELPTPTVERIVETLSDPERLRSLLSNVPDGQLRSLLNRIEDYEGEFPTNAYAAIPAIYELQSRIPIERTMFSLSPDLRVARVALRLLRSVTPQEIDSAVDATVAELRFLSDRASLLRLVGHREGVGAQLLTAANAEAREEALVDEIFTRSATDLAREQDLGLLIRMASEHKPDQTKTMVQQYVDDQHFFVRLLVASMGEVRSDDGRRLQLRWDRLSELLGSDLLIARSRELPDVVAPDMDEDTREMVRQAKRYAADPSAAESELAEYSATYG